MKLLIALGAIGVVAIVVGAVVVKRQFERYASKSKATEARMVVQRIHLRATRLAEECPSPAGTTASVACLPAAAPLSAALGACCEGGKGCQPVPGDFSDPAWQALDMTSSDEPYRYSYELRSGQGSFTALAYGDLDCDGVYSTYSMAAQVGADGTVTPGELVVTNPDE